MKKLAYVLLDDLLHPSRRYLPVVSRMFDTKQWHICALKNWNEIELMLTAPDLIVNMKDSRDNWRLSTPNHYETLFAEKVAEFVTKSGCGYIALHAGTMNLPASHPLRTSVLGGSADVEVDAPVFKSNVLTGKIDGALPFGCFSNITFRPKGSHPILEGVHAFSARDEQLGITIDDMPCTEILGYAESAEGGRTVAAWAKAAGEGRAVGIACGHLNDALMNPAMVKMLCNAVEWCGGERNG